MSNTPTITDPMTWALDREIVLVRVLDATSEAVFAAWTDADAFCQGSAPMGSPAPFDRWTCARAAERAST
ncbi:MAG: hypothetical protein ACRDRT_03660 [Pseudonocardiaceae bacterium]